MTAIEKLGLPREKFDKIYSENKGFNNQFNKNHPCYSSGETFFAFLRSGATKLVEANVDLVKGIIKG